MISPAERFAAFAYSNFYPQGGFKDFVGFYSTEQDAKAAVEAKARAEDYFDARGHVVDLSTHGKIICSYYGDDGDSWNGCPS